ncbi:hypothetical protein IWQ61_007124 [Dispira simplex]|nr:hypothetical protein IWQ61_007124 [Dispira simplex]
MLYTESDRIQYGCVFATLLLWVVSLVPLYLARRSSEGIYYHEAPRMQYASVDAARARLLGVHENSFEAFVFFALAILFNRAGLGSHVAADVLSIVVVISRALYVVVYLLNLSTLRTIIWTIGMISTLVIYILPLSTHYSN